jgi:spore coat protein CotF
MNMALTQKESTLIKDLRSQEQLCIEKYTKYSNEACDGQLKNLFSQIREHERQHLQTLDQIASGGSPQMMQSSGSQQGNNAQQGGGNQQPMQFQPTNYSAQDKQKDAYLCSDALTTEKHVSSTYNTSIFEFSDPNVRNALNHIQKEEQQHGEQIYNYMSANGMYS